MIRRDYLLRMIEEFVRALLRIRALKQDQRSGEAGAVIDQEFHRLIGLDIDAIKHLSETEIFGRLAEDGPTHTVREKAFMLATLLKEAGDLAAERQQPGESRECWLKALHVLLDVLSRGDVYDFPEFVPKIEILLSALAETPLLPRTSALLMRHYERTGEFGKAEDALFEILEQEPDNAAAFDLGVAFYERLRGQSKAALIAGNLPREEVEAGLLEVKRRLRGLPAR